MNSSIWNKLKKLKPKEIAHWLEENIGESEDGFFQFNGEHDEKQFEDNVRFLESEMTISIKDVSEWKQKGAYVIASTIDGDYIIYDGNDLWEIPKSLIKKDVNKINPQTLFSNP